MPLATWQLPKDIAASKSTNMRERMKHYRFVMQHFLNDGTRIIPTIPTMKHIFDAYDQFELKVAICANSYTLYVKDKA